MTAPTLAVVVFVCLTAAVFLGRAIRRRIPAEHLSADSRDTIKLAMGLVVTMTALLLGLLVGSSKGSFDGSRGQVMQLAAKIALLDRVLIHFGPTAEPARVQLRRTVSEGIVRLWPVEGSTQASDPRLGDQLLAAINGLDVRDDAQRALRSQAVNLTIELAHIRAQLEAQSAPSVSMPLLAAVVVWLIVIFLAFSLLAPQNRITLTALVASALSVSVAILLILELDQPFEGLFMIPKAPILHALGHS